MRQTFIVAVRRVEAELERDFHRVKCVQGIKHRLLNVCRMYMEPVAVPPGRKPAEIGKRIGREWEHENERMTRMASDRRYRRGYQTIWRIHC